MTNGQQCVVERHRPLPESAGADNDLSPAHSSCIKFQQTMYIKCLTVIPANLFATAPQPLAQAKHSFIQGHMPRRVLWDTTLQTLCTRFEMHARLEWASERRERASQRKGDRGFGGGNFRALFESIERQHKTEGRI